MTNEEGFQYYCETVPMKIDIGNLHVIDYYLHHATRDPDRGIPPYWLEQIKLSDIYDFDIETEQWEGWAYDDVV